MRLTGVNDHVLSSQDAFGCDDVTGCAPSNVTTPHAVSPPAQCGDFAKRSRVHEPRSACNPLSLKAVSPADRCNITERRKTIKHVTAMQALISCGARTQHPGSIGCVGATNHPPDWTFDNHGAVGSSCSSRTPPPAMYARMARSVSHSTGARSSVSGSRDGGATYAAATASGRSTWMFAGIAVSR